MKLLEKDKEGVVNSQLQWQLNLLAHVESLQDEVIHRMDFIEKELDGKKHFSIKKNPAFCSKKHLSVDLLLQTYRVMSVKL